MLELELRSDLYTCLIELLESMLDHVEGLLCADAKLRALLDARLQRCADS